MKINEEETEKKPCKFCKNKGFPNRFHAEEVCRLKLSEKKTEKNDKIKLINNASIQECVSASEIAKNE